MDLSDLENLLEKEGRELLRRLIQGHLDVRAKAKVKEPVVGSEGEERETSKTLSVARTLSDVGWPGVIAG